MATRARIGIKQKSGRIIASYQHWDGYPGGLGYLMKLDNDKDFLGNPKGTWYYVESRYTDAGKEVIDDAFKPLEEDAIKDQIDILNRTLEMIKERKAA